MNFEYKTEIIRFSRCVVFPPVSPLSHFAVRAGVRVDKGFGIRREKKKRKKSKCIKWIFNLKFICLVCFTFKLIFY